MKMSAGRTGELMKMSRPRRAVCEWAASRMSKPKLEVPLILLLSLFYQFIVSDGQTRASHQDHRRVRSQHTLTRYYHDIQQNEIYKRHDIATGGSGNYQPHVGSLAPPRSDQDISLRQVLVPLLEKPIRMDLPRASEAEGREKLLNYKSSNNRGPANAALQASHHERQPFQRHKARQFVDSSWRFGQRRRQDLELHEPTKNSALNPKETNRAGPAPVAEKSASWSQPDPRTSYSLPISLVRAPKSSSKGAKRLTAQSVGRLLSRGAGGASLRLSSETLKRYEPDSIPVTPAEQNASTSTQASETGATPFEWSESEKELAAEHYQQPDSFVRQQKSIQTPAAEDEIQPKSAAFGGRTSGLSELPLRQQSAPMVTLIRYVPVVMNVPAEQVAGLSSGQKAQQTPAKQLIDMSSALDQIYRPHGEQSVSKYQALATAKYHLIDSLLPPASNEPKVAATLTPTASQAALVDHTPAGDISSDYSHLYPASSGAIQLAGGQAALAFAANGQQLTRLAYVPVGQPQVALPSGHAASKALSAYASRLISMLRPSSLLSSIGGASGSSSPGGAHFAHHQQAPTWPHIYVLAPAEPLVSGAVAANQMKSTSPPAVGVYQAASAQQKTEDTLMNQASKVHSTKSQGQPTRSGQQARWPTSPQMNGLVCIQGMIKTKQQQQQPISQSQMQEDDSASFDYDRPQQQIEPTTKSSSKQPTGGKAASGKSSRDSEQARRKMSPIRMMQKMANKRLKSAGQQYESADGYGEQQQRPQQQMPITQQKLMSSSSDNNSIFDDREQEAAGRQAASNLDQAALQQSPAGQEQEATRSNIIPFTIRDKIDVPTSRARSYRMNAQAESGTTTVAPGESAQTNGPVQYDEPSEPEPNLAARNSLAGDLDQPRWSRTSFVSTSPRSAGAGLDNRRSPQSGRRIQQPSHNTEINYRKETHAGSSSTPPNGSSNDFALPVLMASSSSFGQESERSPRTRTSSYIGEQPAGSGTSERAPLMEFSRPRGAGSAAPPAQQQQQQGHQTYSAFQKGVRFASHELMGSPSSSSSISTTTTTTTTTTTALPKPTEATPPALASSSPGPASAALLQPSQRQAADELGQLISSITLTRDSSARAERPDNSGPEARRSAQSSATSRQQQQQPPTRASAGAASAPNTVELVINSTPRETHATPPSPRADERDYFVSQNITASPLYLESGTSTTRAPSPQTAAGADEPAGQSEWLAGMNSFSHDRTLSSGSPTAGAQFGRISESLQTNPLDLIDLQNSRSSFELPAQLESLSMLHGGGQTMAALRQSRAEAAGPELESSESARDERRPQWATSTATATTTTTSGHSRARHSNHRHERRALLDRAPLKRDKLAIAAPVA